MSAIARVEDELRARPRTWLVTGAAGFIGSHLCERLLALGQSVRGVDDLAGGRRENLAAIERAAAAGGAWRFECADVCDERAMRAACEGVELVLHQAALGSVPRSLCEPERVTRVNAAGTWTVLAAAHAARARRVVLASSSSVYGDACDSPQREERIGRPLSPYAASKQIAELAAAGFSRALGFESVALRYFNVFGPRQDPHGPYAAVVARWGAALAAGAAPQLEGDGLQTRDFTPVASVVAANLLAACARLSAPFTAVNVGTGRETALATLLSRLLELYGELCDELGLDRRELRPQMRPARSGDRRASRADTARARALLGHEPPAGIEDGLCATLRELVDSPARSS